MTWGCIAYELSADIHIDPNDGEFTDKNLADEDDFVPQDNLSENHLNAPAEAVSEGRGFVEASTGFGNDDDSIKNGKYFLPSVKKLLRLQQTMSCFWKQSVQ